jgi:integrase
VESILHSSIALSGKLSKDIMTKTPRAEKPTWRTMVDIMGLPPPATKPAEDYPHVSQQGFFVRLGKKRRDGVVRRSYIARVDVLQPDGTFQNGKVTLGLVEDYGTGDKVLTLRQAEDAARKAVEDSKRLKAGDSVRLTVGDAYAKLRESLDSPTTTDSPDYASKMTGVYARFLSHLAPRHLDTLKEGFWIDYLARLRTGKLQVGTEKDDAGKEVPVLRKAGSVSYALGVLNAAARLYRIAHEYRGIEGEDKGWDPTRAATEKMEAPNERETFLRFEDLPKAWAATDQLMSPWWRDLWRVYLCTGLRDKLVMDMRFDQIDFDRGLYLIEPLARGAKRRRKKLSQEERKRPIEMPLSSHVLGILKKRQQFAPKGEAGEWVWYSTETARRKTKELPRLTDPRSSWQRLTPVVGYWCYKHDLRRTFASVAATIDPSAVLALSLLMLHSSKTVSKALGVPQITVEYIKGQQRAMRALTEKVSRAVLELAGELPPTDLTAGIREYVELPASIHQLLALEEKAPTRGEELAEAA